MTMLLPRAHTQSMCPSISRPLPANQPNMAESRSTPMMLAVMIDRFDHHAVAISDRTFMPNHAMTWFCLYPIPPRDGRFPRMDQNLAASFAQATISYGLPQLEFTPDVCTTLLPSRLRHMGYMLASGDTFQPQQARERRIVFAMRAKWKRVLTPTNRGSNSNISTTVASHTEIHPSKLRFDVTLPHPFLPRPFFIHPWRDVPILRRLANATDQHLPGDATLRASTCALIDATAVSRLASSRPQPLALMWDITQCHRFLNCELETFLFPLVHFSGYQ